ncbi:serine/threonine-protein kinase [Geothrix sp. SG200]|uniref:serine/threonine-protein kinase n=1 Tax=Geothrix sp. SG200 TaxID=2922865 RepID=UPI00325FC22E
MPPDVPGPTTPLPRLDLARALVALHHGWITPARFRELTSRDPAERSVLGDLRLDPARLAELYGSTVLLAKPETLSRLAEDGAVPPEEAEALGPGDWIAGRYRILEVLRGGFGRILVCEARTGEAYARGNRRVALKTPLRHRLADLGTLEAFHREAAQWIALGAHPNLVLAYGVEEHLRLPFLVMEYVEGACSLHQEIQAGRMNWLRALWIALDTARGLAYAEQRLGLVHGDLKPLNLLLTPSGSVKVADFGLSLSRALAEAQDAETLAGTPAYLAPEMWFEAPQRTARTDMYAFGATLYETVTGRTPFPPDQPWLNRVQAAPDPRRIQGDLPSPFADLILACLDRDPDARPGGFQELLPALEALHLRLLGTAPPASPEPDAPAQADALANLAASWTNLGRLAEAVEAARKALRLDPDHWKAHCALGEARLRQGDPGGALASFEAAHRAAPGEVAPLLNAALAARDGGEAQVAAAWLERGLRLCEARNRYVDLDTASLLLVEHLPGEEALALLDRILEEDPAAVMTWNNRAVLLRRLGLPAEAAASADRALAINPLYAKAWSNRATALVELGRLEEGLEAAGRALELDPRLAGAYAAKAAALARLGRLEAACACIRNGLRLLPGNALLLRAEAAYDR